MPPTILSNKLTGKASFFLVNGIRIYLTKYTPNVNRMLVENTDGADYDPATDMLHTSQKPVKIGQDLDVEGYYDLNKIPQFVVQMLYSGVEAVPVQLGLKEGILFGAGNFDIENFSTDVPIDNNVTFKARFKSNGIFTPGGSV